MQVVQIADDTHSSHATATAEHISTTAAPKTKKVTKPKVPATHPPYTTMITTAIKGLGDKNGSSRQDIHKYVVANNKVDASKATVRIRLAMTKLIAAKKVVGAAAAGKKDANSFKLAAAPKKEKKVVAAAAAGKKGADSFKLAAAPKKVKKPTSKNPNAERPTIIKLQKL